MNRSGKTLLRERLKSDNGYRKRAVAAEQEGQIERAVEADMRCVHAIDRELGNGPTQETHFPIDESARSGLRQPFR